MFLCSIDCLQKTEGIWSQTGFLTDIGYACGRFWLKKKKKYPQVKFLTSKGALVWEIGKKWRGWGSGRDGVENSQAAVIGREPADKNQLSSHWSSPPSHSQLIQFWPINHHSQVNRAGLWRRSFPNHPGGLALLQGQKDTLTLCTLPLWQYYRRHTTSASLQRCTAYGSWTEMWSRDSSWLNTPC